VGLDLAIRVGTGLLPPPRPLILGMSLPLEFSYTKSVTYLGKLEEHVVILAVVFSLTIFTSIKWQLSRKKRRQSWL